MNRPQKTSRTSRLIPYSVFLALLTVLVGLAAAYLKWLLPFTAGPLILLAYHSYKLHKVHLEEVADLHLRTIAALAVAIDAKDATTHEHLNRVVAYAAAIGAELGLREDQMKALRAASLLHDIGKLAVPEYIISKPGRLTEEEFEKMKIHTVVGAEILEQAEFPYPVVPIVRSHHERWNGTGYPDGLKDVAIPIGARILAAVDAFDALSSDRQYRRALPLPEAMEVVKKEAGICFDPKVVEILERIYPRVDALLRATPPSETRLSTEVKIERGKEPKAGLSIEKASDTSSALYWIVRARQELQILYELTQALGSSLNVDETHRVLADQLQRLIGFDTIAIYLIQDEKLVPRFVDGVNAPLLARVQIPVGQGLSGWVAGNGKCSLNGNPTVEPGYIHDPGEFSRLRSALSVPLDSPKGIIGVLTLYSMRQNAFTVDHLRILKSVGVKAGAAIHNALIHEAMGKSAETDGLTGLPNARALAARLEQESARALRQNTPYSVFVIDLNRLKQINDTLGHLTGNRVIKQVARALQGCLREYDLAARMGGDEFVLLLPGMDPENAATKRIELSMAVQALNLEFPEVEISVSMGSASFPADRGNFEELIALADRRMYFHKRDFHRNSTLAVVAAAAESSVAAED